MIRTRAIQTREIQTREQTRSRVRAAATGQLDAVTNTSGIVNVYKVPIGYELEVRRVFIDVAKITETTLQQSGFTGFPQGMTYYRSGVRLSFALTQVSALSLLGTFPGVETWAKGAGPVLKGGEVFQLTATFTAGSVAGSPFTVNMEGVLTKIGSAK